MLGAVTQVSPTRFFVRCQNCRAAYVATLSRFTPWVCKRCGYDHGVRGTSLEYGEQMHNPVELPAYDLAAPRGEPAAGSETAEP